MKKIISVLMSFTLVLFVTACKQPEKDIKTIRVSEVTHSIFYAPFYVAIENGYFEEENIKIDLTNGGGSDKCMTSLLSKSADIGLMGPEAAIYVYLNGKENYPKIFGQLTKRDGSFLISRQKEENFNIENLKEKEIIAGRKGGMPAMTLEYLLNNHGLHNGKNIRLNYDIQFNLTAAAFDGGTGDYCTLFEPTASEFEKQGKGYVVKSIGLLSGEVPYTAFMALNEYIENNENIVRNFLKAVFKAINFIKSATEYEIVKSLKNQFPSASDESIINSIKRYNESDAWCQQLSMKKSSFKRLQDIMENAGELTKRVEFEKIVLNKYADEISGKIIDNI